MRLPLRALPPLAGLVLTLGPAAQAPVHLTTLEAYAVPAEGGGPVRVAGRPAWARPLASGAVLVWASATPVAHGPAVEAPAAALAATALPAEVALGSVFPNPLAATARVPFELPAPAAVRLAVYDALGREVAVLVDGSRPAGAHEATLDAGALAPGVYFVRLSAGPSVGAARFTVVR